MSLGISPLERRVEPDWQRYLLDSLLAAIGALLVTAIIYFLHLYPRIPDIGITYLLVILPLASTRGRYAAIFASIVAFLAFDFFLVPPLYMFTIARVEEWVALFVFLVTAIFTSQLASALRERAALARRREHETRILYELVQTMNQEESLDRQLQIIANAIVTVFSSWGVLDCVLLLPDEQGALKPKAGSKQPLDQIKFSPEEQASAAWVMAHREAVIVHDVPFSPKPFGGLFLRIAVQGKTSNHASLVRRLLLPLETGQRIVGVLRLQIQDDPRQFIRENLEETGSNTSRTAFFWAFLDQAASAMELARLRSENMRIEVLQRTDTLRAALLSSVSHDLRTPLASIKAAASSLLQEDVQWDDETRRSFARTIVREADRLNHLVGNLLDMSRIEEGVLKPEKEWYPLDSLIHDVIDRLQPLLQDRIVNTSISPDLPAIELDYLQMDQVLTNLLENAVRYTPPESPIDISVYKENEEIIITVADRGPGIPPTELERIFDKFYRVQRTPTRRGVSSPGSGLGLAVCKGLVEAHGGRIWARPRVGGGVTFFIALPIGQQKGEGCNRHEEEDQSPCKPEHTLHLHGCNRLLFTHARC
jgi:two-component system sensor histidine kinase KdpD